MPISPQGIPFGGSSHNVIYVSKHHTTSILILNSNLVHSQWFFHMHAYFTICEDNLELWLIHFRFYNNDARRYINNYTCIVVLKHHIASI